MTKTIILQSCDVNNASEDTTVVMAKEKRPISATYCAASNSYMTSCRNQTDMPGINMHYFSKDENLPQKWIGFVRISLERFPSCEKAGFMLCIFCSYVLGSEFS